MMKLPVGSQISDFKFVKITYFEGFTKGTECAFIAGLTLDYGSAHYRSGRNGFEI